MNEAQRDFDSWYRDKHPQVLVAVAAVCAGDHGRAEDATNDAFVKALERWETVSTKDSPTSWVARVAINNAKRTFRRHARQVELLNSQRLNLSVSDRHVDLDLWESLNSLTFRQRKAIVLRYLEDLTQNDVANELGIAVGTASATLSQARQALRSELTGE